MPGDGVSEALLCFPIQQHHLHHGTLLFSGQVELAVQLYGQVYEESFCEVHLPFGFLHVFPHPARPGFSED